MVFPGKWSAVGAVWDWAGVFGDGLVGFGATLSKSQAVGEMGRSEFVDRCGGGLPGASFADAFEVGNWLVYVA